MIISHQSEQVRTAIQEARTELSPYLERLDLEKLSKHNRGYLSYADNPVARFIDAQLHAYSRIVDFLYRNLPESSRILDIGFFIPVVPIALAKLGFEVLAIEKLAFYDDALASIVAFASRSYGIEIFDLDILHDGIEGVGKSDAVILAAILEHLNGTPRKLLQRARALGKRRAYYLVTVPNVAALAKRLSLLLKGSPPHPSIAVYYHSAYPFTGHNREYTIPDLRYVLSESGFDMVHLESFNHQHAVRSSLESRLIRSLTRLGPASTRETIFAVARQPAPQWYLRV